VLTLQFRPEEKKEKGKGWGVQPAAGNLKFD
jgi:hypothetical protein